MAAALVMVVAGTGAGGHLSERETARVAGAMEASRDIASRSEKCPSAHRAVRFYSRRIAEHRAKMGAGARDASGRVVARSARSCPRYLAHVLQRKARAWRQRVEAWLEYHYAWSEWLPDKWQRIGACETGYGKRPGRWDWNSGTYQGAFGFYHGTWDQYKPRGAPSEAYLATPRQQYQCALNVYAAHGYGAWGCGGA